MIFKNWTIGRKLWLLSGLLMANLAIVGVVEFKNMAGVVNHMNTMANVHLPAVRNMTLVDMKHDGLRAVAYRAILASGTKDASVTKQVQGELEEMTGSIREYMSNIAALSIAPETKKEIEDAQPDLNRYCASAQSIVALALEGRRLEATEQLPAFLAEYGNLESRLRHLGDRIQKDAQDSRKDGESHAYRSTRVGLFMLGIGMLIALVTSFGLIRNLTRDLAAIVRKLNEEAAQVGTSAEQLNTASRKLSETTTEQAAAIEETVSSMEEMTSMLSQTSSQATKSLETSESGRSEAEKAKNVVMKMSRAMEEIQSSNTKLEGIVRLIEEIRNKTNVINDIVFETRLLSFNASIEAARAGAQGKGFAVVAEEVGKLASMSGKAADEIRTLLDSSTQEVAQAVKSTQERVAVGKAVSQECEAAFQVMGGTLQQIAESVRLIAAATRDQEVGVKQTNTAMNEMDQVTQANSRSSELLAAQATRLASGAVAISETSRIMRAMVFGAALREEGRASAIADSFIQPKASFEMPSAAEPRQPGQTPEKEGTLPSRSDSRWKSAA